jgi:hypothetical protein
LPLIDRFKTGLRSVSSSSSGSAHACEWTREIGRFREYYLFLEIFRLPFLFRTSSVPINSRRLVQGLWNAAPLFFIINGSSRPEAAPKPTGNPKGLRKYKEVEVGGSVHTSSAEGSRIARHNLRSEHLKEGRVEQGRVVYSSRNQLQFTGLRTEKALRNDSAASFVTFREKTFLLSQCLRLVSV